MAFNWKNRNITYKHINLATQKITKDTPWYNQLGAVLADTASQTNDNIKYVSGILIFNKKLKGDENKDFLVLNIGIKEKLKLNVDADVLENNRIFIKFYRVMPPKASPAATKNLRLMYAVEDPNSSEHQKELYKHPQMVKVNEDGTFELPIGNYGRRGWEIIYVSKTQELYKYLYRYQDKPYLPIDNLTIDFSNNGKLVKKDEIEKITEPDKNNMCEYKIPYFGIQDRSIIGTGYYGGALYDDNNFQTKNKVKPFNSTKPRYWNLSNENYEIIYDGEISMNDMKLVKIKYIDEHTLSVSDKKTHNYSINSGDKVLVYVRKPGHYQTINGVPYYKIRASQEDWNLLKSSGITDVLIYNFNKNNLATYYISSVTGSFSSVGQIDFDPMDIIDFTYIPNKLTSLTFSTYFYPYRGLLPINTYIPLSKTSDSYKFYSHIINYTDHHISQQIQKIDYEGGTANNKPNKVRSGYLTTQNWINCCYIVSRQASKEHPDLPWNGTYTAQININQIPSLNKQPNITLSCTNEPQLNTFIKTTDKSLEFLLNFIKIGGTVSGKTTAGLIDSTSKGIIGTDDIYQTDSWNEIQITMYDENNKSYQETNYYIAETQKTRNSIFNGAAYDLPEQYALKSWIGWSTRTLPTSYAIWVVIWRWSDKTN